MIRIEKAIKSRGLTQAGAAKVMRVTQPRVSDLLRGLHRSRMIKTVGDADFDERLTSDPKAARLAIDLVQQWHGKINVDPLNVSPRTKSRAQIQVRGQVNARVVLRVEHRRGQWLTCCGSAFLLHVVPALRK
jgi:hypothetical protein